MNEFPHTSIGCCGVCKQLRQVIYVEVFGQEWAVCLDCCMTLITKAIQLIIAQKIINGE